MCPELDINKKDSGEEAKDQNSDAVEVHSQLNCTNEVMLQTLQCILRNGDKRRQVRVLLDPGSQRSYILEKTAKELGARSDEQVKLCHLLFGGRRDIQQHNVYEIEIEGSVSQPTVVKVLGHQKICGQIPRMAKGPWMSELKGKRIFINDIGDHEGEIEVLIGADYYATWLTGRKHCLNNGLVALETCFGWTLTGKLEQTTEDSRESVAMMVTTLFVAEAKVPELWALEVIGINDPVIHRSREEKENEVTEHFIQTVTRTQEGRYSVSLP